MHTEVVYSPDDDGWYCEVVDDKTGKTLHTTKVFDTRSKARTSGKQWIEANLPTRNA